MANSSDKKPTVAEAKQQLEAMVGAGIEKEQLKMFQFPVGAFDYTAGSTAWRRLIIFPQPSLSCTDSNLLDASGVATTGTNGQVTFLLSQFVCLPLVRAFTAPISIVATPRADKPFFATTEVALVPDPSNPTSNNDLQITLFAWDANGAAAASVSIDWRARLVSLPIIL